MTKKHRDQDDIEARRSVKRMLKNGKENKKKEKGWHKAPTYVKPMRYELEFIPLANGRYRVIEVEKKK